MDNLWRSMGGRRRGRVVVGSMEGGTDEKFNVY